MPEPVTTFLAAAALACAAKQVHQGHKMKKTVRPAKSSPQLGGVSLQYDNATRLTVEETYHKSFFSRQPKLVSRKISTDGLGGHVCYQEQSPVSSVPPSSVQSTTQPEQSRTQQLWGHVPAHPPSYQSLYDVPPWQSPAIQISDHSQQRQLQLESVPIQLALEAPPPLPQRHAPSSISLYSSDETDEEDEDMARAIAASLKDW